MEVRHRQERLAQKRDRVIRHQDEGREKTQASKSEKLPAVRERWAVVKDKHHKPAKQSLFKATQGEVRP